MQDGARLRNHPRYLRLCRRYGRTHRLVHLGAREYDFTLGRFLSVDPVLDETDPAQMNAYSYAHNNPITSSDLDAEFEHARITRKTLKAVPRPQLADTEPPRPEAPDHRPSGLPADPHRARRRRPPDAGSRHLRGPRPADSPEAHRRHPFQAEATGNPGGPRRTRARPVRSVPHLTVHPPR
ncbi:hypothetical protein G3I42_22205 [Streptomyces sp. SID11385]|nr:hypothetical protein [Streptomyces sp. SID11385]